MVIFNPGEFKSKIEKEDTVVGFCENMIERFEEEVENIYSEVYEIASYTYWDEKLDNEIDRCCNILGVSVTKKVVKTNINVMDVVKNLRDISNRIAHIYELQHEIEDWFKFDYTDDVLTWDDDVHPDDTKYALSNLQTFADSTPIEMYQCKLL
jgi:hypothetical protein